MNADSIKIEWDEDGCYLIIDIDPVSVSDPNAPWTLKQIHVRLNDPEQAYDAIKGGIGPWLRERDEAKAEYDRAKRAGDTRNLSDEDFSAYLDDAYGGDWSKREGMSQMREQGYA